MSQPNWVWLAIFAVALLGSMVAALKLIADKLDRVAHLLESIADQQAEANSSLRSLEHDSNVIRERTPSR